ncbi:hypothetical protein D3C83_114440 [compost metagenome]
MSLIKLKVSSRNTASTIGNACFSSSAISPMTMSSPASPIMARTGRFGNSSFAAIAAGSA